MLGQKSLHIENPWKSWSTSWRGSDDCRIRRSRVAVRGVECNFAAERLNKEWVLAIDVGTGGTKAALISARGNVSASAFAPHPAPAATVEGGPASMEQDQDSWWLATKNAVWSCLGSTEAVARGISVAQVCAVAVTGQMQDVILLPGPGSHKRCNAILYSDARAQSEAAEIAELGGGSDLVASITGFPQGASSVLAKLRWLDKRDPKSAHGCRSLLLGGHDYVVWKLCGLCVTDATTASTTGLTNATFQYAEDLLEKVELGHWIDKLPTIVASNSPCGELSSQAAVELGCAALQGVPVIHCCGDAGACTLGAGAGERGTTYAYLGTSGWVAGSFAKKSSRDKGSEVKLSGVYTLAHPDPSLVFKTGSIMTAGGNLAWAASNLVAPSGAIDMKELDALVKSVPAGSGGLLYLPYLNGERCPFEDPHARASFVGISAVTTRGHLLRSVMEGVAFAMRSARDAMFADQLPEDLSRPLYLVGGGARSPVWPAIMAAVFGQTVDVLEDAQEVGVKGAALLAGQWLGWQCGHENWVQWKKHIYGLMGVNI
ncbi:hypothetical protein AXG93_369s1480 [Marchantia polymorpha subsp. ruderalis]|uniref:glycerol kinase n=1 Tax=Marchantia polymorpha subsp. ruderalis TaxID=1480154 RepID=A0A176VSN0_MARPO|nr:hypothetical protein AXG93_369s1480 [Marchantia polymorpha subsp. ruderalis]